jgi:hypothetical protein
MQVGRHRGRWEEHGRRHEQAGSSNTGRDGSRRAEMRQQTEAAEEGSQGLVDRQECMQA